MTRKERGKERESLQFNYIYFYKIFNKIMTFKKRKILYDHRMTQLLAEGAVERMIHLRQHL